MNPSRVTLSHLGIAVNAPEEVLKLLNILGLTKSHEEKVTSQGVMTHFVDLDGSAPTLELLEPLKESGPDAVIAKYLATKGPGVHHLAFQVKAPERLSSLCEELSIKGYRLIYPKPVKGAHGALVNFIHPRSAGGLLFELLEFCSETDEK